MPDHHVLLDGFVPRSSLPGVRFPALPRARDAVALSVLAQLAESQWWTPDQLREHQLSQLELLVRHAAKTTRYGRRHLVDVLERPLTWERWAELPLLPRRTVQQQRRRLISDDIPKAHGRAPAAKTSGSTGVPVVVERTDLDSILWHVVTARDHLWWGRDTSLPMATIRHRPAATPPEGVTTPVWGPGAGLIGPPGACHILHVSATTEQQLDWLQHRDFAYLLVYPSGLRDLLVLARRRGVRFPDLRAVRTFGEVVSPDLREEVRETWGVEIHDLYSTQEAGYLGLQCPGHTHYHVPAETVHLEVLHDDGTPCLPGETGRVVVTPLHSFAMPLIRYDLGDYAVVGEPCPCGRGLPVIERILGRVHQTFVTRSGDRIWLTVGVHLLRTLAPVVQHQMVQRQAGALELRLVPSRPPTQADANALRAHFAAALPEETELTITWVDEIERASNGKFLDFISEIR